MKPFAPAMLVLGLCMLPALAQTTPAPKPGPRPRPEEGRRKMEDHMDKALNLTEAQKASYKEIQAKHKGTMETKRKAAMEARKAFMDAMGKAETSTDELRKLHRASTDAELEVMLDFRASRQEFRAILTPEQREKAARMEGRMEGMRMGHRGGFPDGKPGPRPGTPEGGAR